MQRTDSAMSDIKQCLRKKVLAERRALSFDRVSSMSLTLTENLLALPEVNNASCIMAFLAMPGESNLDEFIRIMLKNGTRICIPVCLPKRQMEAGRIMDMEHFEKGPLGLRNIPSGYDVIEPEQIDLVLVPAVACDRQGRRLGMGAGYYDRYLVHVPYEKRIAALWDFQVLDEDIPGEPFDQNVSAIVTDKRIIRVRKPNGVKF